MSRLDTLYTFETPEGVELGLRVAGPLPRALAWAIDTAIRYLLLALLTAALLPLAKLGTGALLIALFLTEWFYPVLFEVTRGTTPGKQAMGLRVVHDNGTPVGWPASLLRNLLRAVDFFPLLYGTAIVSMLCDHRSRRLGDLAAGTLVVYAEHAGHAAAMAEAPARPVPVSLPVQEQRALIDFAERGAHLAPGRVEELAEILSRQQGPAAVREVLGYAHWVARGR